jgi:hypothetical protein
MSSRSGYLVHASWASGHDVCWRQCRLTDAQDLGSTLLSSCGSRWDCNGDVRQHNSLGRVITNDTPLAASTGCVVVLGEAWEDKERNMMLVSQLIFDSRSAMLHSARWHKVAATIPVMKISTMLRSA